MVTTQYSTLEKYNTLQFRIKCMKKVAVSPILGSSVGKYKNGCDGSTFIRLTACAKPHLKHSLEQEMPILKMPHQRNKTPFIPLCRIILLEMWGLKDICGCKYSR